MYTWWQVARTLHTRVVMRTALGILTPLSKHLISEMPDPPAMAFTTGRRGVRR